MNCTICNSGNTEVKFHKNEYKILRCTSCSHVFTDFTPTPEEVEQIYSDDYFFKGGAGYEDYTLEKNMLIKRGAYYAEKVSHYLPAGNLLDAGCACGFILKGFIDNGWTGVGIEPNATMVRYAQDELHVPVFQGTLENNSIDGQFDLIVLIQVMAHFYDLHKDMDQIKRMLKPGGHILVETWNEASFTAKIFGKNWHEYSPPGTLNYFSRKSLRDLFGRHGFKLVTQGYPKKHIHSKHARSLIRHKLSESKSLSWLSGIYKLIPKNMLIRYPSEDLFWALYTKPADYV